MPANSRRGFLRTTLGTVWTGAGLLEQAVFRAQAAQAQSRTTTSLPKLFDVEKVADGVYAAIAKPVALVNSNAAIFERDGDLLIVDTHSKPSAVVSLVSQLRRDITDKPVRYIVNSHFHWDHTQGNPAYRRIAPRADIVASSTTRRLIAEQSEKRMKDSLVTTAASLEDYRAKAAAAKDPAVKAYWQDVSRDAREFLSEMQNWKPELPNVSFDRDLMLHDKYQDLHLAFRGKGHTEGDVVVISPSRKVVATGDLLHGFAPFIGDGFPKLWPATLRQVAEMPFEHVIGGHGGVQHSKDVLFYKAAYMDELNAVVQAGKQQGKTVADLQKEIVPASLKSLSTGYGAFLQDSLFKLRLHPPDASKETLLADSLKSNIADTFNTLERT